MESDEEGYLDRARAAAQAGDEKESDAVLLAGVERFPQSIALALHHGWKAMERGEWEEAVRRWAVYRARFPDEVAGFLEGGKCLNEAGRAVEADALIAAALERFPTSTGLHFHYGWFASGRADWQEAVRRWKLVCARLPEEVTAYIEWGIALRQSGQFGEADLVLAAAVGRFPEDVNAAYQFAMNAKSFGNRGEELKRWTNGNVRFPDCEALAKGLQAIRYELRLQSAEEKDAPQAVAATSAFQASPSPWANLFNNYESLGENCEFGFVQRHFGSEPLSLLRWGYIAPEALLAGLNSGFEGVGDPQYTLIEPNFAGELILRDIRYFAGMHTFVFDNAVDREQFHSEMCKRLRFLKRKLIRDLTEGRQIFLYRSLRQPADTVLAIFAALRRYGPNKLLFVSDLDQPEVFASTRVLPEGLMTARIKLSQRPLHELPDHDAWLAMCRRIAEEALPEVV